LIADPQHRFGQALTLAMNPKDINKSVYFGLYGALNPLYTYNDPAKANQLLDAVGMDKRGSDGFRLGPDGQPFIFSIVHAGEHADQAPIGELLKQQFEAVGVHTEVKQVDVSIFNTRKASNDLMASLLWNDGPSWNSGISHFSPVSGWIGDPDGMGHYQGTYYVFWWGHAESKDLVHWTQQPFPMLSGKEQYDYYSGSVVVDQGNTSGLGTGNQPPMVAVFTLHPYATGQDIQALALSSDYTYFNLYDHNPILDSGRPGTRDPQVWFDAEHKRWLMVIALADDRKVSFYTSPDLKSWTHLSDFGPVGAHSGVWEVPDLFKLPVDGDPAKAKWVLLVGMGPNQEQYFIGDFDGTKFTLDPATNGYLLRGEGLPGSIFADFEHGLPDGWKLDGRPIAIGNGDVLGYYKVTGYLGDGFLSTYPRASFSGDPGTVKVTSPTFTITNNAINFLISGSLYSPYTGVNLLINGAVVRSLKRKRFKAALDDMFLSQLFAYF